MKKILLLLAMLLNIAFVSAAVDIVETNKTQLMEPGDLTNINFSVTNTGAASITVSFTHNVDLEDDDGSKINLTLPGNQTINPGQTLALQITADVPTSQDFDEYIGTVTATASDSTTDTFQLTIDVQPIVCDSGIVGSSLDISIEDPDDGEDIKPGDTLSIDVDVDNDGSDDIDVQVDAFLFNDEESVESSSSTAKNVADGETEDFKLSLKVPTDAEELGEDERFRLYVKAFDDNNEDVECTQEFIELNLDLKDKDVVIDDSSRIIPGSAVCGELASAQITVVNIGDEEIDRAYITLRNSELRINQRTDTFDIEEFTAQEENSVTRRLEFRIPNSAAEKTYQFETEVNFDGGSNRETLSLTVDNCEASKIDMAFLEVKVELPEEEISLKQGITVTVPVKITNTNSEKKTFKVYLNSIADFAESASVNTLTLLPGQSLTSFLDVKIKEDTEAAKYSGLVQVSVNGAVISSRAVTFDVKPAVKEAPLDFMLIGIVGALLVIVIILAGFMRPKTVNRKL